MRLPNGRRIEALLAAATVLIAGGAVMAQNEIEVDLELVLAVDISRSMDFGEAVIQRRGYIDALLHEDVLEAIASGPTGRIAVTYVEWSGPGLHAIVVPWMLIDGRETAVEFTTRLESAPVTRWQATSISDGLLFSASLFPDNGFVGSRDVIDISGDGPNNMGLPVLLARDMVIERGIVINGLPIMINDEDPFRGLASIKLDRYYEECVIGGQGAFIVAVDNAENFAEAIRRKMVLEIAAAPSPAPFPVAREEAVVIPVQAGGLPEAMSPGARAVDCLIGERVRGYFGP